MRIMGEELKVKRLFVCAGRMCTHLKSTGIVRKVDELGRIVLPIELRRIMNIAEKDALEIYVDGETIMLKKYAPCCVFCNATEDVISYKGKNVCGTCLRELKRV